MGLALGAGILGAGALGYMGSKEAGKSSQQAASTQAASQMQQLEYLKEINKLPQEYREQALTQLSERFLQDGGPTQEETIAAAKGSPLYAEIMGGLQTGEEAILRQAGATGGLRSGGVQENLAKYAGGLERSALTQSYNEQIAQQQRELMGLQGLAGLDTGSQQIGQTMADIGATQASGILGQGQSYQQGLQNISNIGMQGLGLAMYGGYI